MKKEFRTIVFLIPAALCAAIDASEMAMDFLSKVDWLRDDARSLGTEIRRGILQAVRGSIGDGQRQVAVSINVFSEECMIQISQEGSSAKRCMIRFTRDTTKGGKSDEEFPAERKASAS